MAMFSGSWSGQQYRIDTPHLDDFRQALDGKNFIVIEFIASQAADYTPGLRASAIIPIGELVAGAEFHASAPFYMNSHLNPDKGHFAVGGVELTMSPGYQATLRPTYLDWYSINGDNPDAKLGLPKGIFYNAQHESLQDVEVTVKLV